MHTHNVYLFDYLNMQSEKNHISQPVKEAQQVAVKGQGRSFSALKTSVRCLCEAWQSFFCHLLVVNLPSELVMDD